MLKRATGVLVGTTLLFLAVRLGFDSRQLQAQERERRMITQTCYAEVQWQHFTELRRGPSYNYGIKRLIPAEQEMRVFGRNEAGDWFQVYLDRPLNMIGWIWLEDDVKLYGYCNDLPVTTDNLEPEIPLEPPPPVYLPAYAEDMEFSGDERLYYLNEGMLYVRHEEDDLRAHIVIADLSHSKLTVETALVATPGVRNGLVTELARERGALVAINGDFYTSSFVPQNLMIIDGQIVTAPKLRATFAITQNQTVYLGYFTQDWSWDGSVVAENGAGIPLQLANVACDDSWVCLYTDVWSTLPLRTGYDGLRVLISPEHRVLSMAVNERQEIPTGHFVLRAGAISEAARWLRENLEIGTTVEINTTTTPDWRNYEYAIGGGPMIVKNGRFWQDCDPAVAEERRICEEFNADFRRSHYYTARLPRSAVGYNPDRKVLILIMVEGKNIYDSKGITQRDLAEIFIRLGARSAMEFDGGGSSVMWLNNSPINGFTEDGERYVVNALLLFWNDED